MQYIAYDIEVFQNCFIIDFYVIETGEHKTFIFHDQKQDTETLDEYLKFKSYLEEENVTLVSFNGSHFDQPVLKAFHETGTEGAFLRCDQIINSNKKFFETGINCDEIDVFKMLPAKTGGLKKIQARLGMAVVEFDGDFSMPLPPGRIDECVKYCKSDTESTAKIFQTQEVQDGIKIRRSLKERFQKEIWTLNRSESQLGADVLIGKLKQHYGVRSRVELKEHVWPRLEFHGDDLLPVNYTFHNPQFSDALMKARKHFFKYTQCYNPEKRMNEMVNNNEFGIEIPLYSGGTLKIGEGGLHLHEKSGVFSDNLVSVDVKSQYPNILSNLEITPNFEGDGKAVFLSVYNSILNERMNAKRGGDKLVDKALKIPLNAVTGEFKNSFSPLCDPAAHVQIVLNAQFSLLKLIDELINSGAEILHVNTDGIVFRGDVAYTTILKEWETETGLELDIDILSNAIIIDTNNYSFYNIEGREIKVSGRTLRAKMDVIEGGIEPNIVAKAIKKWALDGIEPGETVAKSDDINDFIFIRQVKTPTEKKGVYRYVLTETGSEPVTPAVTCYGSKITYLQEPLACANGINRSAYLNMVKQRIKILSGEKEKEDKKKSWEQARQRMAREAEALRDKGFAVIPLAEAGKKPLITWSEYQKKLPSKKQTKQWFRYDFPDIIPNIGIITGKVSGVTVVDVDTEKKLDCPPETPIVKTGKGRHYYFVYDGEESKRVGEVMEVKADGCYVLAPPSVHPNKSIYRWEEKDA